MHAMSGRPKPLRLRAKDADDLFVVSAMTQDAIVAVRDIGYALEDLRFVMVINRFMWERRIADETGGATPGHFRTLAALRFEQISRVERRGIDQGHPLGMLDLLAIEALDAHTVQIHFAGDASLRLTMAGLDCHLEDLGEPWPSHCCPAHVLEQGGTEDGGTTVDCSGEADHVALHGVPRDRLPGA